MYKLILKKSGTPFSYWDKVWLITLPILFIIFLISNIKIYHYSSQKKMYDGVIKIKFQDELKNKSGDVCDYRRYFIVKFDSIEETKEINVDNETYFSHKQGQRVSFKMTKQKLGLTSSWFEFFQFFCLVGLALNIFFLIGHFVNAISHANENYNWIKVDSLQIKLRKIIDPLGEENWDE